MEMKTMPHTFGHVAVRGQGLGVSKIEPFQEGLDDEVDVSKLAGQPTTIRSILNQIDVAKTHAAASIWLESWHGQTARLVYLHHGLD